MYEQLIQIAIQIITNSKNYYIAFEDQKIRDYVYNALIRKVTDQCIREQSLEKITYQWQTKQISNYQYLMHLNQTGNRSISDLSQYPVFPWVIKDYNSSELNLQDRITYRDLTKPIGVLNPKRFRSYKQRYEDMSPPKFLYGSHYSTPGYVIGYLVRKHPEYMLKLQGSKFDKPDRLFKSIKGDWKNVYQNPASLKQLIPQFYQKDDAFLVNRMRLDLGVRQNKKRVDNVKVPKWASSAQQYLQINRTALQSQYVSQNLHHWIDLIFGYKQRGPQAIKADNVFNYITYEGMVDIDKISDPIQKNAIKCQINQFGQCPRQIFKIPHPSRSSFPIFTPIKSYKQQQQKQITKQENYQKVKNYLCLGMNDKVQHININKVHKNCIMKIVFLNNGNIITIGQDGFLKVVDYENKSVLKSFKISDFCLSSISAIKQNQIFAIGSWDNKIYIFNLVYGSRSKPTPCHDNSIISLCYLSKHKRLLSGSWDCTIKQWILKNNSLQFDDIFIDHQCKLTQIINDNLQQRIAFGDVQGSVKVVQYQTKQVIHNLTLNNQKITNLCFLKQTLILAGTYQIKLLDTSYNQMYRQFLQSNMGNICSICLDEEHLFVITQKKNLSVFDLLQEKQLGSYFRDKSVFQKQQSNFICISGNKQGFIAIGTQSGNLHILKS